MPDYETPTGLPTRQLLDHTDWMVREFTREDGNVLIRAELVLKFTAWLRRTL